ncbi:MAG: ABC transporter permease [Tissierellales bacterium]|jgi:D-methionine transport system permease protein|nr:ABC transporter permease [Tissierellales bacterium]
MDNILELLGGPLLETLYMVFASSFFALIVGLPLGIILYITGNPQLMPNKYINQTLGGIVNIFRSFPFIVLMILLLPLSRIVIGTSIGTSASILPLSIAAAPFIARVVENALLEIDCGIIEAARSMGSSLFQIILKVLLPESLPSLVNGMILTIINLIGYSAMAGAIGGGGLGDLAIRYGYYRFQTDTMLAAIIVIIILVQSIQFFGNRLVSKLMLYR